METEKEFGSDNEQTNKEKAGFHSSENDESPKYENEEAFDSKESGSHWTNGTNGENQDEESLSNDHKNDDILGRYRNIFESAEDQGVDGKNAGISNVRGEESEEDDDKEDEEDDEEDDSDKVDDDDSSERVVLEKDPYKRKTQRKPSNNSTDQSSDNINILEEEDEDELEDEDEGIQVNSRGMDSRVNGIEVEGEDNEEEEEEENEDDDEGDEDEDEDEDDEEDDDDDDEGEEDDDEEEDDEEDSESNKIPVVAAVKEMQFRANRGTKINYLMAREKLEAEKDDFWKENKYFGKNEDLDAVEDEEYSAKTSGSDEFDTDFDRDSDEDDKDDEDDSEEDKKKKKSVLSFGIAKMVSPNNRFIEKGKKDNKQKVKTILKKADNRRENHLNQQKRTNPILIDDDDDKIYLDDDSVVETGSNKKKNHNATNNKRDTLRESTRMIRGEDIIFKKLKKHEENLKTETKKEVKSKFIHEIFSQKELLMEAAVTELANKRKLEDLIRLEEEKKIYTSRKKLVINGSKILYRDSQNTGKTLHFSDESAFEQTLGRLLLSRPVEEMKIFENDPLAETMNENEKATEETPLPSEEQSLNHSKEKCRYRDPKTKRGFNTVIEFKTIKKNQVKEKEKNLKNLLKLKKELLKKKKEMLEAY